MSIVGIRCKVWELYWGRAELQYWNTLFPATRLVRDAAEGHHSWPSWLLVGWDRVACGVAELLSVISGKGKQTQWNVKSRTSMYISEMMAVRNSSRGQGRARLLLFVG
jgi:hypothetical protein